MADGSTAGNRVERLRNATAELAGLGTEAEIFEYAVDVASDLVPSDACVVLEDVDGRLEPAAARDEVLTPGATPLASDEGIAGETLRTGTAIRVDDVDANPIAAPRRSGLQSALSVRIEDDAVLQVLSAERSAYGETEVELIELLADHVAHAVDQVRYEAAVERERDRFVALFQNVPDAAVQYHLDDGQPRIQRVNSAFVRLFGYDPEEAVGKTTEELLVPEDERQSAAALYDEVRAGDRLDAEVVRKTVDGERPFLLRSVPVWAESGDVAERVGYFIYTDISELQQREAALARKNERLDQFARIVSHDLRNPLSVAKGYLEEVRAGDTGHVETIGDELDRMERMIDDLLTLARQGSVAGDTEPVALDAVAQEAWSHVRTRDATLAVDDSTTLEADPDRLAELLENLFRNSVEHGVHRPQSDDSSEHRPDEEGSDADSSVTVTVGPLGETGFFVADDGRGIPPDRREEVFEMGVSTAVDGTGFGLGIVQEIAAAHDWRVDVSESTDGGARFEITAEEASD